MLFVLLSGCDSEIVTVRYDFGQPPRLVYIANVDTELDFYGATLFATARDGYQYDEYSFFDFVDIEINHSIDFSTPGHYEVELLVVRSAHRQFEINFFIQVIDEEIFNQLNSRTR